MAQERHGGIACAAASAAIAQAGLHVDVSPNSAINLIVTGTTICYCSRNRLNTLRLPASVSKGSLLKCLCRPCVRGKFEVYLVYQCLFVLCSVSLCL